MRRRRRRRKEERGEGGGEGEGEEDNNNGGLNPLNAEGGVSALCQCLSTQFVENISSQQVMVMEKAKCQSAAASRF
jgi:hypothetical protein